MIETLETELEYQKPGKYSTIKPLSSVKTLAAISFIKASISIGSIELRRKSMSGESFPQSWAAISSLLGKLWLQLEQ
jgi:hypothetical protein